MKGTAFLGVFAFCISVAAHGQVTGIVAGGKYYHGYLPSVQNQYSPQKFAGWSIPQDSTNGPVYPSSYNKPDIICHLAATAAAASIPVVAGSTVELQWTPWPVTHHGPVIDYLANCNGPCSTVDKTRLEFQKIDASGLLGDSTGYGKAGYWGADKLRDANNSWTLTIPSTIAPGNYVLRHEIIALHSARVINGAQNYPHCINLEVSGAGTDGLAQGTPGTELYKANDPGILIDIYKPLKYTMPGPAVYSHSGGALTSPDGDSRDTSQRSAQVAPKAQASVLHNAAPPITIGSLESTPVVNNNITYANSSTTTSVPLQTSGGTPTENDYDSTGSSATTAAPQSSDPAVSSNGNLPPGTTEVAQATNSVLIPSSGPNAGNNDPLTLPSIPNPSQPTIPLAAPSIPPSPPPTSTPLIPAGPSSSNPPLSSTRTHKPCTRRVRTTTSSRSAPVPSITAPLSSDPLSSTPSSASMLQQNQEQAPPAPAYGLPSEPSATLDEFSVQQLMRWLKAIVTVLSRKTRGS